MLKICIYITITIAGIIFAGRIVVTWAWPAVLPDPSVAAGAGILATFATVGVGGIGAGLGGIIGFAVSLVRSRAGTAKKTDAYVYLSPLLFTFYGCLLGGLVVHC